jgi:hypothetical protein
MRREWLQIMANVADVCFQPWSSTSSHQHQVIREISPGNPAGVIKVALAGTDGVENHSCVNFTMTMAGRYAHLKFSESQGPALSSRQASW